MRRESSLLIEVCNFCLGFIAICVYYNIIGAFIGALIQAVFNIKSQLFWPIIVGISCVCALFFCILMVKEHRKAEKENAEREEELKKEKAERGAIIQIAEKTWQSEIEPALKPIFIKQFEMSMKLAWDVAETAWVNANRYKEQAARQALRRVLSQDLGFVDTCVVYKRKLEEVLDNKCKEQSWIIPWKMELEARLDAIFRSWQQEICLEFEKQVPMAAKIEIWKQERRKNRGNASTKQKVKRKVEPTEPKAAAAIRRAIAKASIQKIEKAQGQTKGEVEAAKNAKAKEEQRQKAKELIDKWIERRERIQQKVKIEVGGNVDAAVILEGVYVAKPGSDKVEIICSEELFNKANIKAVFVEGKEFIYVIQNSVTKSVKIGYANNPYRRLAQLQTSNESMLILKGCIKGNVSNERTIQAFFKKYNIFNEWFEFSNPIKEYVSRANLFIPTLKTSGEAHCMASQFDVRAFEGISRVEPGSKTKIQIDTKGDIGVRFDKVEVRKKSFVYLIQNSVTKSVKVGYAANPYSRCSQLQTGNEHFLILLGCLAGDMEKEAKIHNAFSKYKKMGEWFSFNDHIEKFILTAKQNGKLIYPNVK